MLVCLAFFFRDALLTGLHFIYGDSYDGMIEVSILNHWYSVLRYGDAWNVTSYFYPYPATLGYNDTNFVPGIPFAIARLLGADPFLAVFLAHVCMKGLGFAGMYVLLRRGFAVWTPFAVAGAALFTTSNASLIHMYHGQLLSVSLFPWLGFLALRAVAALTQGQSRALAIYGSGFALLFGVTAFNAFYGLWFFSLFLLISTPIALLLIGPQKRHTVVTSAARQWRPLLLIAIVGVVALIPMLLLYLPKMREGAHWGYWVSSQYQIGVATLVNVGSGNLVWGHLKEWLGLSKPFALGESQFGIPFGLLLTFFVALFWAVRTRTINVLVLGLATLTVIVLGMRLPGNFSLWWVVFEIVPGASAVRVVSRLLLFALVAIIPVVIVFLDRTSRGRWFAAVVIGFLLVEEVQLAAPLRLDRGEELAMIRAVGAPPSNCSAIFVVSARDSAFPALREARTIAVNWGADGRIAPGLLADYRHNVDAMILASYYHVPTINGVSSFNPPNWNFKSPDARDYGDRVRTYAKAHAISSLCGLDMRRAPHWFPLSQY